MSFEVHILGSNSAAPAHGRHHTSQVLCIQDLQIMIDCGEATQLQMKKYGLKKNRLSHIFISHLHGDHFLGLIGLLSTMHLNGRKTDLYLYGPVGLSEIIQLHLKYANTRLSYKIHFKELQGEESELILDHPKISVYTIPLQHRIPCTGFLIKEKPKPKKLIKDRISELSVQHINTLKKGKDVVDDTGKVIYKNTDYTLPAKKSRSYAYCSDTKYNEDIIPLVDSVDLLYHEGTFLHENLERAEATYHTTAKQAAIFAQKAKVGKLLIGHFSNRYKDLSPILEEAKTEFDNTALAEEGKVFTIEE
ncbi:ribonuclease Z [Marivirga arenosa]|uniref:Ribonuclease Z n=1 Tax=Marivirga arenosa TaxID=3059076 RepID=A0AA51NAA3_9BACT|nr:ribonuclease Z [Marivirga sp. ABR2-2]WMN07395.1 ribonuclease Z [Marivirga sp. ABR2-2]